MKKLAILCLASFFLVSEVNAGGFLCGHDGRCNEGIQKLGRGIDKIGEGMQAVSEPAGQILQHSV